MDFLKQLIGDNMSQLVSGLTDKTGFSAEQAEKFVPEAARSVVDAAQSAGNVDFSNLGEASRSIVSKVDVAGLAQRVGIDTQMASSGLTAMVPQLLQTIQEKAGGAAGMMSMLGGLKSGGVGGMLGGMGKIFGK